MTRLYRYLRTWLTDLAERIDTRWADAINGEGDET